MQPLYHVMARTQSLRPVFNERAMALRTVRRVARFFGPRTLWFCVADNHLHQVVEAEPAEVSLLRRNLDFVLRGLTGQRFDLRFKPVEEQSHLLSCWPYVRGNREHHGLLANEGSGIADIVGARLVPGFDPRRWERHIPRRTLAGMLEAVDFPGIEPMPKAEVRAHGSTASSALRPAPSAGRKSRATCG